MRKIIGVLMGAAMLVGVAGPASAGTNNQQFSIVARFSGNETTSCRVVATGPIQGAGTCTVQNGSGTVTIIHMTFPNGTVDIRTKEIDSSDAFNLGACVDNFTFKENFRITGATGAFAGATGSGTDTGRGVFAAARTPDGHCDENQGRGAVVVTATGHVNLGGAAAA